MIIDYLYLVFRLLLVVFALYQVLHVRYVLAKPERIAAKRKKLAKKKNVRASTDIHNAVYNKTYANAWLFIAGGLIIWLGLDFVILPGNATLILQLTSMALLFVGLRLLGKAFKHLKPANTYKSQ